MTRLIGLDIGTSGCKAIVLDSTGAQISAASREYPIDIPQPTWAEQDAELVWTRAREALSEAIAAAGRDESVAALGLSVQGEAVIPVDGHGNALRPAILGMDTRTGEQNRWLADHLGAEARRLFYFCRAVLQIVVGVGTQLQLYKTYGEFLWEIGHDECL